MQKFYSLIICLAVLGCASRPDTAPIENATDIPGYLLQGGSVPPATPVKPSAPAAAAHEAPATMGSLNEDDNNGKPVSVNNSSNAASGGSAATLTPVSSNSSGWMIPTAGKSDGYKASVKGIDIYGTEGQPIYAANDGKVVYSGNGLKGYGNLIIIKHDSTYLTAYAHNKTNLVKEGASVKRGQRIAEMGQEDSGRAMLHFELRKNGKPINPFTLIKND